jgi:eukaryotic-like serine/threonine-protein kinase
VTDLPDLLQRGLGPGYTIERELGGGGMSRVAVAFDTRLGRRVAIKILPPDLAATVSKDRFRREILLAARLQHPHIVAILSAGEVDDLPYLIMPYIEGESLRARLARGPLGIVEAVRILRDVGRALAYAHDHGIVHRDIKPDNVLLSAGSAMVTDFGVAKALVSAREETAAPGGSITIAGTSLGTPAYMAPEQVAADPTTDHRADLYAFGVMAYEMLAGLTPFHGRTRQALLAAHLTEAPPSLAKYRADVPRVLCDLIMRCLEKDPARRPQTAGEIVAALDDPAVVSGAFVTPIVAVSSQQEAGWPAARTARRVPLIAAAALVAIVLAVVGVRAARGPALASRPTAASAAAGPSIAVLPLVYVGADSSYAYVTEGVANAITGELAKVRGLRVASRGTASALQQRLARGDSVGAPISTLLEGMVEHEGDRLRVAARLVSATDGFMVWSDMYERDADDVFALEDEIAKSVAEALRQHFGLDSLPATGPPAAPRRR